MAKEAPLHVMVVPWLAFGHMMPFYQFSLTLAKHGVKVTFISTPNNIRRLPKPPPHLSDLFCYLELQLPKLDNEVLPEGAEATIDVPFEKISYLKIAFDLLRRPFKHVVEEQSPDWIIVDVLVHWAADIAEEYNVPVLSYSVFSAGFFDFFGHMEFLIGEARVRVRPSPESLTSVPEWIDFPSQLAYRSFETIDMFQVFYGPNSCGITDAERIYALFKGCKAIATRSCYEFEGKYLKLLQKITGKDVIPVGLLPPENDHGRDHITDEYWIQIFEWLDVQKPKSVVFVGFGSECKLSREQVYEMAYGLELSGLSFLWALRKPEWAIDDVDALPSGFDKRVKGRGVVSIGWAPQLEILSHPSIGGSLFHSGWGSVIENLQFGNSLVVLPLILDQPLNARILVEKGLAVEVDRRKDGSFSRDDIAKALTVAMVSEEGEKQKIRAREASEIVNNKKLQENYFGDFVDYLKVNVIKKE